MKKIFTLLSFVTLGTAANAQNLVVNGDFENGLTPWAAGTTAGYTAPTIAPTGGNQGPAYATYAPATATTGFYQNVPVTAGKTYVIEFWYKTTGASAARLWSVYKNSGGTAVYTTTDATTDLFRTSNKYLPIAAAWTKYTAKMPAEATATSLDVAFRAYGGQTTSYDDILAYEEGTLATIDPKTFDKKVKMNTLVSDNLTLIELPSKSTVNIYSVDGKLVSSNRVNSGESINVSKLQKGNYIVTVEDGTNKVSRKIVKK